ncbi:MAG: NusG domain II-containing protein [bacterium]
MKWLRLLTLADKVLILLLISISIASLLYIGSLSFSASKKYAVVEVDGKEVQRVVVTTESKMVRKISFPRGEGVLEVFGGKARMRPMTRRACPQGICSRMGWIQRPGEMIVCVPNKLIVRIEQQGSEVNALDAVTY